MLFPFLLFIHSFILIVKQQENETKFLFSLLLAFLFLDWHLIGLKNFFFFNFIIVPNDDDDYDKNPWFFSSSINQTCWKCVRKSFFFHPFNPPFIHSFIKSKWHCPNQYLLFSWTKCTFYIYSFVFCIQNDKESNLLIHFFLFFSFLFFR